MASPAAVSGYRPGFPAAAEGSSSKDRESAGGGDSDVDFRFKLNRPSGFVVSQPPMFTIPPGLSPASLLDSPGFFSTGQVFSFHTFEILRVYVNSCLMLVMVILTYNKL